MLAGLKPVEVRGGSKLTTAAMEQLLRSRPQLRELAPGDPRGGMEVTFRTDIPRQSGLSGSSAIVIAALVSLMIELLQAWVPSRDSSALDLTLNTSGGVLGAWLGCWWLARKDAAPAFT